MRKTKTAPHPPNAAVQKREYKGATGPFVNASSHRRYAIGTQLGTIVNELPDAPFVQLGRSYVSAMDFASRSCRICAGLVAL